MFFLSLRAYLQKEFIITDSAIESSRSCVSFDDMGSTLADLQILTAIPKLLNGEDPFIEHLDDHAKTASHVQFYRDQNFNQKRILHLGKKHMLNHRFIIYSEKSNTRLLLHVKWMPKSRKHMIGFVEELPLGR
jgi:hypothetical protein